MAWDDNSNGKKGKNPWGSGPGGNGRRGDNPWGGRGGSGGGGEPPDLDEMLRKAQENFRNVMPGNFGGGGAIVIGLIIGILVLWFASGFYIVSPGEHAVIQQFGAYERTQADPGLGYHLPAPIESASILNVQEIQKMNIGFMELRNRADEARRQNIPAESLMLTADRNIVDLHMVVQWNIKSSEEFLFNIEDQVGTIKKVAESAIREVVGQTDMFPIITTGRSDVANRTREIIQRNLDEYQSGVQITDVLIEKAAVHPDVNDAFQDVQSAKQDAENVQNEAEAYREDILPRARGQAIKMLQQADAYKQSKVAQATGDADRFNSVYEAYLQGEDVTRERIFIETMEDVLSNAQKIIMDENSGSGVVPYLPLNELRNSNTKTSN